jgi:hypothetical protein
MSSVEGVSEGARDVIKQFWDLVNYSPPRNPRYVQRGCGTLKISSAVNAVRMNWKDLPEEFKLEFKRQWYVDDSDTDRIIVSLIRSMNK